MSVVSRKFTASPVRTAAQVWETIVSVIADGEENVKTQLSSITGIVSSIISDETPKNNAITVIGSGPRLRIYCLYDDDAIEGDEASESVLSWKLFEKDWEIHFPVEAGDFDWVTKLLNEKGNKFKTYKAGEKINESDEKSVSDFSQLSINTEKLN